MFTVFKLSFEFQELFLFKVPKFSVVQMMEVDFVNPFQVGAFTLQPTFFFSSFANSDGAQIAGNPLKDLINK